MIFCINCKPDTKNKMDKLLSEGEYRDYSEIVAVAIDNLWMLEQEVAEKGALVIGEGSAQPVTRFAPPRVEKAKTPKPRKMVSVAARQVQSHKTVEKSVESGPVRIPGLFLADGLDGLSVAPAEIPVAGDPEQPITLDRWLFGQYNKLLPVKANCRALLRIAAEHPDGVLLEDAASQIAEAAALLGDYLAQHDRRHQIARDELLATAFPRSGIDAEKGRARYANQFVGSVNSHGVFSGLLWDYRLAAVIPSEFFVAPDRRKSWDYRLGVDNHGEPPRLALTERAVQFARLTNPVLDGRQTGPAQKFSPEEVAFLLDHIRAHVPAEAFAFRTLVRAIADGAVTPDKLDEALRVHVPAETNRSLSPSFLTSQRSGALSRMADLGLIARERKGVRVSYTITSDGEAFVQEGNTHKEKENVRS